MMILYIYKSGGGKSDVKSLWPKWMYLFILSKTPKCFSSKNTLQCKCFLSWCRSQFRPTEFAYYNLQDTTNVCAFPSPEKYFSLHILYNIRMEERREKDFSHPTRFFSIPRVLRPNLILRLICSSWLPFMPIYWPIYKGTTRATLRRFRLLWPNRWMN